MTNTRHGVPPGYTPPVTHAPVVCWRCRRPLTAGTGHEEIRVGGRAVAAHRSGNVECVPTLSPQRATEETP